MYKQRRYEVFLRNIYLGGNKHVPGKRETKEAFLDGESLTPLFDCSWSIMRDELNVKCFRAKNLKCEPPT